MNDTELAEALKNMDQKVAEMFTLREESEVKKRELAEILAKLDGKQAEFTEILKLAGKTSHKCAHGTVYMAEKWRVNVPKTQADKIAFFNYLKSQKGEEVMWQYVTCNSNSLQPLYTGDWEKAKEEGRGMEFAIPGIQAPSVYQYIGMKKS